MNEDAERESEEVDVEPYEGAPEFEDSPTKQTDEPGGQDDGELPPYASGPADNRVEGLVDAPNVPNVPEVPNA